MDESSLLAEVSAQANRGDVAGAIAQCRLVASHAPRSDAAHFLLAQLYQRQGDLQAAIAAVNAAIEIFPSNFDYYNLLGVCHMLRNELAAAELCFRHAIENNPGQPASLNNLGLLLINKGQLEEALPVLERAHRLEPVDVNVICNLATIYRNRGDLPRALGLSNQAIALEPQNIVPKLGKAACLRSMGCDIEALSVLENIASPANKALPAWIEVLRSRAAVQLVLGHIDDACAALDEAIALKPNEYELIDSRAQARKVTKEDAFFQRLQQLEARVGEVSGPAKSHLCHALGKGFLDIGDIPRAAKFYALAGSNALLGLKYNEKGELELLGKVRQHVGRSFLDALPGERHDSRRPIFVLGMERSGTTLIAQMLGSHPDVFVGGELRYAFEALDGLRLPDGSVMIQSSTGLAPDSTVMDRAKSYLHKLDGLKGSHGFPRIVDKMPANFMLLGMIHAMFPNAYIIHCRRDPLDTCISSYTTHFANPIPWSCDLGALGRRYRAYWDLMEHWRRELPGRFLELRYEQVVENFEASARGILQWCDLAWDDSVLRFYESDRPVATASFTQVRQPIYHSSIGRWRKWEGHIQPLLSEIQDIQKQYWEEIG